MAQRRNPREPHMKQGAILKDDPQYSLARVYLLVATICYLFLEVLRKTVLSFF